MQCMYIQEKANCMNENFTIIRSFEKRSLYCVGFYVWSFKNHVKF